MNSFERHPTETTDWNPKVTDDLNLDLAKTLRLKACDVTAEYAEQNIQNIGALISFMLASFQKRADGGHSDIEQAERIEQMCLLHPHFSGRAKKMLANALDLSEE